MSELSSKRPRTTPRNSTAAAAFQEAQTPFQDLHQLGKLLRKETVTPQSSRRVNVTTAGQKALHSSGNSRNSRTPNPRSVTRSRRGPPLTPHAIRAQQVYQSTRNAGASTPGRDRRRSGRFMRDTPRDDLRQLSRLLAVQPKAALSSSPRTERSKRRSSRAASFVEDDSPTADPPRMSLPPREMDDDSFHENPPRMSIPPEDYEVEGSRREWRRDRESFGNPGFGDFQEMDIIEESEDEGHQDYEDAGPEVDFTQLEPGDNETTRNLRALIDAEQEDDEGQSRYSLTNTDGEPTFQFRIAERSRLSNVFEPSVIAGAEESIIAPGSPLPDSDDENGYQQQDDDQNLDVTRFSVHETHLTSRLADIERSMGVPQTSPLAPSIQAVIDQFATDSMPKPQKVLHKSKSGAEYPSLPAGIVKKLAGTFSKSFGGNGKINKDTLDAIMEASDWFFEQASEDLAAYAKHAKRKTIEEADVITLMKRQRQLNDNSTIFSVAQKFLPGELLRAVKMAPSMKSKSRKRRLETVDEEDD